METTFTCHQCGEHKVHKSDISTGYGRDKDDNKICFDCCGKNDLKELTTMKTGEKVTQYWDGKVVSNWPGTLKISPTYTRTGKHNIAGTREDVWFNIENQRFHGIQYGNNTQIIHIKKVK